MVRMPGKGKKIAWGILGKPANMQNSKDISGNKENKKSSYWDSIRSR